MAETTQDAAQASASKDRLAQVLEASVAVVMLRMQGLPGNRRVPNSTTTIDGKLIEEELLSAPTLRLIPPDWGKKFTQLHTKAEKLVQAASPPKSEVKELSLPNGCYLIAGHRKETIAAEVNRIMNEELIPLRESFCDAFPEILESRRQQIASKSTWDLMLARIPSPTQLRAAICLRFVILPFTFLNEAGRALAEEVAESIVRGVSETLEEEAGKIAEKIAKGQMFREGSFTLIRQQFQMLRDFSFLADEATLNALKKVEQEMDSEELISNFNTDVRQGGAGVVSSISQAITALTKEAKKDAGGRYRRKISVD
jgi:cell fate (sporulation/competence/biofilm development) regulator YlbF (YheA/YmcA/DUF963 family)